MTVTIIIKWVSHYRLPFYEALKRELQNKGIEFILIYGEPTESADREKKDWVDIPWGVKVTSIGFFSGRLIWQPALSYLNDSDIIIVEHANKLLLNYFLQTKRIFTGKKLAFWGHGRNFQSSISLRSSFKEKFKESLILYVDWWFAYNELCAIEIHKKGFPTEKITNVENAVDTAELKRLSNAVTSVEINNFKNKLQINGVNVAVFCGGMFYEKRLPFLLECAMEVREIIPDFQLIFIGAGPEQKCVEAASKIHSWIYYLGPLFGKQKVLAMKATRAYLMPGLVGLGVLDAFALGLPVITTDYKFHSPEISYVKHMENGIITVNNQKSFVDAVTKLFMRDDLIVELKSGCGKASEKYTIENMAKNFCDGIVKCLSD